MCGEQVDMLQGKHFVIFGLSKLSVRISAQLIAGRAQVSMITQAADPLTTALDPAVNLTMSANLADTIGGIDFSTVECVLTLAEEDLDNLRAAVLVRRTQPDVPVVVRAFDPALADQLEAGLKVRRAFSVSALAAPAFAMAAAGHAVLETLRIADGEVPIVHMKIGSAMPLAGTPIVDIKPRHRCALLAYRPAGGEWVAASSVLDGTRIQAGDEIVVGGLLDDVLTLGVSNSPLTLPSATNAPAGGRRAAVLNLRRRGHFTLMPRLAAVLVAILIASVFVFEKALHLRLVDSIYFVITTATTTGYGDISLKDSPDWLKMYGGMVMLAGGALLGVVFSQLAAVATADRLDELMGRQAARMRGHVIVAGLGNLGYRTAKLLRDVGLRVAVVELTHNARFAAAVGARCPVLIGDSRLPEDLQRAGVSKAGAVIACTNDDLANIQTCLHARRLNSRACVVARVFDEALAERMSGAFDIDVALSASTIAAKAFVGAATDERAFRAINVDHIDFLTCRYTLPGPVTTERIEEWRTSGVRVLAWRRAGGSLEPPMQRFPALDAGSELVICGPPDRVRQVTG